jgi:hypothetical protein
MRLPQLQATEILRLLERLGYERVGPPGGHIKMRQRSAGMPDLASKKHKGAERICCPAPADSSVISVSEALTPAPLP